MHKTHIHTRGELQKTRVTCIVDEACDMGQNHETPRARPEVAAASLTAASRLAPARRRRILACCKPVPETLLGISRSLLWALAQHRKVDATVIYPSRIQRKQATEFLAPPPQPNPEVEFRLGSAG